MWRSLSRWWWLIILAGGLVGGSAFGASAAMDRADPFLDVCGDDFCVGHFYGLPSDGIEQKLNYVHVGKDLDETSQVNVRFNLMLEATAGSAGAAFLADTVWYPVNGLHPDDLDPGTTVCMALMSGSDAWSKEWRTPDYAWSTPPSESARLDADFGLEDIYLGIRGSPCPEPTLEYGVNPVPPLPYEFPDHNQHIWDTDATVALFPPSLPTHQTTHGLLTLNHYMFPDDTASLMFTLPHWHGEPFYPPLPPDMEPQSEIAPAGFTNADESAAGMPPMWQLDRPLSIRVQKVIGEVEVIRFGQEDDPIELRGGERLKPSDRVYTGIESKLHIRMADGSVIVLEENTDIKISAFSSDADAIRTRLWLRAGQITTEVKRTGAIRSDFRVRTPTATCSVRGTNFAVSHAGGIEGATTTIVREGEVEVTPWTLGLDPVMVAAGGRVTLSRSAVEPVNSIRSR